MSSKHPYKIFPKEDSIHLDHRFDAVRPRKPKPDLSHIEVRLDQSKIVCKTCKISENFELPFEYQDYTRNTTSREKLREITAAFRERHTH